MKNEIIKEKENQITAQIETVNDMLEVICKELNELENIDDFEIELDETDYTMCVDKRPQRKYKILVTCKRSLESYVYVYETKPYVDITPKITWKVD